MRKLTREEHELGRKIRKHLRAKKLGKLYYDKADELLNELLKEISNPAAFSCRLLRSGKKLAKLKDNYATSNTAFRAHGIKRFELEVVEVP